MKYIIILSFLFLTACSSQPNRCNRSNGLMQCQNASVTSVVNIG